MTRSRKLSHHIARYLGSETAEADLMALLAVLKSVTSELIPSSALRALENLPVFLDVVDSSYQKYEENLAVAERNISVSSEELVDANRAIRSMVNSLGQGFLMFGADGICAPVYSKSCESLLETIPAGKPVATVLRLDEQQKKVFGSLLGLVFKRTHAMSFEEVMRFAPRRYAHSGGAHIEIDYKADLSRDGCVDRIVLVATDISERVQAQALVDEQKSRFDMLERISHDCSSFCSFMRRVLNITDSETGGHAGMSATVLLREVHTLKGGASMFRLNVLARKLHDLEADLRGEAKKSPPSVNFCSNAGFHVLERHRSGLLQEVETVVHYVNPLLGIDVLNFDETWRIDRKRLYAFADYLDSRGLADVREVYIKTVCSESLVAYLKSYDLVLNDLASRLNKKIGPICFSGEDVPIIVEPYRDLFQSFVHLFRNMADHGIETPDDRLEKGKPEAGRVDIAMALFERTKGDLWLRLDLGDDGAGIDVEKVRGKLSAVNPNIDWGGLDEKAVVAKLLEYDVTTRDQVGLYSGCGTGLGAVYDAVRKWGGSMSLETICDAGTHYRIEIPYRLDRVSVASAGH